MVAFATCNPLFVVGSVWLASTVLLESGTSWLECLHCPVSCSPKDIYSSVKLIEPLHRICATIVAPTPLIASNFMILAILIRHLGEEYSRLSPKLCEWRTLCSSDDRVLISYPLISWRTLRLYPLHLSRESHDYEAMSVKADLCMFNYRTSWR